MCTSVSVQPHKHRNPAFSWHSQEDIGWRLRSYVTKKSGPPQTKSLRWRWNGERNLMQSYNKIYKLIYLHIESGQLCDPSQVSDPSPGELGSHLRVSGAFIHFQQNPRVWAAGSWIKCSDQGALIFHRVQRQMQKHRWEGMEIQPKIIILIKESSDKCIFEPRKSPEHQGAQFMWQTSALQQSLRTRDRDQQSMLRWIIPLLDL